MDEHQVHLLHLGKGADLVHSCCLFPHRPGTSFTTTTTATSDIQDILLVGGFSSNQPDSPFALSPTLQLNGDLGQYNEKELADIGRAELTRANTQSFRSYTLEADPEVVVLGQDESSLRTFLDSYGGVLQIEPLLVQGFSQNFSTAEDITITDSGKDLHLSFTIRQPIHPDRCTYCGACGSVCPEQCLSADLILDFSRCTFCKECVTACAGHNAIDLNAREEREITIAALLILDDTEIDIPENISRIYHEKDLPQLFASIAAVQVDEVISCNQNICQFSRKRGKGCSRCLASCRFGAVTLDREGVHIDHFKCTECGACLAACPTGALQYERFDDRRFIEYFRTWRIKPDTTVIIGSEDDLHQFWWQNRKNRYPNTFFLEYPQPAALGSLQLFFMFAMGAARICILESSDNNIKMLHQEAELVNSCVNHLFPGAAPVHCGDMASLKTQLQQPAADNPLPELYHNFSFINRREKVAALLAFLVSQSNTDPAVLKSTASAAFGEIICDQDKCTLCNGCVGECKITSLSANEESFTLNHLPALCVQCGTCVELCPENALTIKPGLALHDDFFAGKLLAQADPATCLECGKVFGTIQSLEKVMSMLVQKNLWKSDDNLLRYCETCRVVKLYESGDKTHT